MASSPESRARDSPGLAALLHWAGAQGVRDDWPPDSADARPPGPGLARSNADDRPGGAAGPSPLAGRGLGVQSAGECLGRKLCIADFPGAGGRGIMAVRDVLQGELLLHAPRQVLLTGDVLTPQASASTGGGLGKFNKGPAYHETASATCSQEGDSQSITEALAKLSPEQRLAVVLLREISKGKASFWSPYLQHLPRTYSTLLCWTPRQRRALQFPWAQQGLLALCCSAAEESQVPKAVEAADNAAEAAEADWRAGRAALRLMGLPHKFCCKSAWLWAAATVSSRTLYVPWDAAGALCPVVDLLNFEAASAQAGVGPPETKGALAGEGQAQGTEGHSESTARSAEDGEQSEQCVCSNHVVVHGQRAKQAGSSKIEAREGEQNHIPGPCEPCQPHWQERVDKSAAAGEDERSSVNPERAGTEGMRRLHLQDGVAASQDSAGQSGAGFVDGGYDEALNAYRIYARRHFKAGEQVFICYGQYTNLELLEHYGFVLAANPDDSALLPLPCHPDLLFEAQLQGHDAWAQAGTESSQSMWGQALKHASTALQKQPAAREAGRTAAGVGNNSQASAISASEVANDSPPLSGTSSTTPVSRARPSSECKTTGQELTSDRGSNTEGLGEAAVFEGLYDTRFCIFPDGSPSFSLLALLRLWFTPTQLQRRARPFALAGERVSAHGDRLVLTCLRWVCEKMLQALPSTVEEDEVELARVMRGSGAPEGCAEGDKEAERQALAVLWRIGYKVILKSCVAHCEGLLQEE